MNPIRRAGVDDPRVFGPPPGGYGSGILPLIEQRDWRDGRRPRRGVPGAGAGFAYGREQFGVAAPEAMRRRFARDRDRGEEPGQPRARHLRLRRLPPGPRRDDRRGPRASPARTREPWFGDSSDPAAARGPLTGRGGGTRRAQPRSSTRAGSRRCGGTATRARSSWPPPSTTSSATTPPRRSSRTGCTSESTDAYVADPDDAEVLRAVEPVGAACHRRAAARSRRARACGTPSAGAHRALPEAHPRSRGLGGGAMTREPTLPVQRGRRPGRRQAGAPASPRSTRAIGGVLLRGQKGSAKTTLARGLAALLAGDAPFVELPLGATEDRVIGTLDLPAALAGEASAASSPGLLAAAHGGVLYVDEVNLLADHLVDVLLDVAALGRQRGRARGHLAPPPGALRARRVDEPRGGRAAPAAPRPLRPLRRRRRPTSMPRRPRRGRPPPARTSTPTPPRRSGDRAPAEQELGARLACARPCARARLAHGADRGAVRGRRRRRAARRPRHRPRRGRPRRLGGSLRGHRRRRPARRAVRARPPAAPHPVRRTAGERARRRARRPRRRRPRRRRQRRRRRHGTGRRTAIPRRNGSSALRATAPGRRRRAPFTGRWQPRPPDRRPGAGRAGRRRRRRRHRPRHRRASRPGSGQPGGTARGSARGACASSGRGTCSSSRSTHPGRWARGGGWRR